MIDTTTMILGHSSLAESMASEDYDDLTISAAAFATPAATKNFLAARRTPLDSVSQVRKKLLQ